MENNFQPIAVMRKLFEKDYENKVCVECKSPMPSFVSINNAILLCNNCAEKHMTLGYNVSYIRHLTSEWDPYLLSYLERGGNSRFIRLSKKYDLDDMSIEQKFNTRIVENYRLLVSLKNINNIIYFYFKFQIKSEVLADDPPFEVPFECAKQIITNTINYFPEFENYQIYEGNFKPEKKSQGLIDAFRFVGSGLGSMGAYLANKYQENDMNNKILQGGAAALKGLAIAGKFLYQVGKPVVKYASIRTIQGVGYLCKQAEFQLSDDEKDEEEDEKEKKDKKGKKDKKKTKKNKKKEENENSSILSNNNKNNNQGSSLCLKEGQYVFQPVPDYPTFESINKIEFNNDNYSNQNNDIDNNFNGNNNIINQNPMINNQIINPDFVIPPGLDASCHENSIVGEK